MTLSFCIQFNLILNAGHPWDLETYHHNKSVCPSFKSLFISITELKIAKLYSLQTENLVCLQTKQAIYDQVSATSFSSSLLLIFCCYLKTYKKSSKWKNCLKPRNAWKYFIGTDRCVRKLYVECGRESKNEWIPVNYKPWKQTSLNLWKSLFTRQMTVLHL